MLLIDLVCIFLFSQKNFSVLVFSVNLLANDFIIVNLYLMVIEGILGVLSVLENVEDLVSVIANLLHQIFIVVLVVDRKER